MANIVQGPPNPPSAGKWVLTFGVVESINGTVTIQGAQQWKYLGPTSASITSLSPTSGPTTGGTTVSITGVGFNGANTVYFGTTPVKFTFVSDTLITATTKTETAGVVDVTVVTTNDGTTLLTPADKFTFAASVTPPPPTTWQTGNFGSRLGMYNGDDNGNSVGAAAQVGILDGFTPPLYTSYPWGCTNTINQDPSQNGITAIAQDASSHGLKLMIGFPVSGGVDNCTVKYSTVLSGGRDADAKYFVQTLIANGCADAMIRMGWEMNQANGVNGNAAQYAQAVQHLVTVMRTVPGQKIQFVWNPTMDSGETQADIESYYPGDAYIDGVCLDFYDCYFYTNAGGPGVPGSVYPGISVTWPYYLTFPASGGGAGAGLNWLANFGTTHNKWIGFCECGNGYSDQYRIGGVDNAPFWTDLAQWTMSHAELVKVIGLWDAFSQGWQNGANPKSREALVAALNLTPTG